MNDLSKQDHEGNEIPPTEEEILQKIRDSRGAQLRALIVSWYTGDTYQRALQEQATALQDEGLVINKDWAEMAEYVLEQYAGAQGIPEVIGLDGKPV